MKVNVSMSNGSSISLFIVWACRTSFIILPPDLIISKNN